MKFTKEKSCDAKAFFATKSEADMAAMHTKSFEDERAESYKCSYCPGYHVGHKARFA